MAIQANDRVLAVVVTTAVVVGDVIARGGLHQFTLDARTSSVTDAARVASMVLAAVNRHLSNEDRTGRSR
jgi:hypothetical protein